MTALAPFIVYFAGALLVALSPARLRAVLMVALPLAGAANLAALPHDTLITLPLMGAELVLVESDRLARVFGWLFTLSGLLAGIYSLHMSDRVQQVSILAYVGCVQGAVFSGDLVTLFLFWEGLAITPVFLILARRTPASLACAQRYLLIQVGSGMLLLAGILALGADGRDLALRPLALDGLGPWLIFLAVGIKCGFPLLHAWITDAYANATETGAVVMSALTTKLAILVLARLFPGTELLVWIGAVMATFPIFYALIENDLRRVLAYSLISQLGFMVVGVGVGTELAINGAVAHAVVHVLYKSLLFMSMGAVLFRTGRIAASELGGLYRTMPLTSSMCIVGAASISGVPLFASFVSKSMILSATLVAGYDAAWLALLFASAGALLYAGIKVPYFAFFGKDSGLRPREAPVCMLVAMAIAAAGGILLGIWPEPLLRLLPFEATYDPYSAAHVLAQCQLLLFSALAFVWLRRWRLYPEPVAGINLDVDWLYRRVLPETGRRVATALRGGGRVASAMVREAYGTGLHALLRWHGPDGILARDPIGSYAMLAVVALLVVVLLLALVFGTPA